MSSRRADTWCTGALAAVAYIPLLLTRAGQVAADTKQYLYLDPGRLTTGAASLWDPNTGLGTVTHQNIGYLMPMGPYYTLVAWLGVPMWVGQRLWMGSLMFAAGAGVAYAARQLGLEGPGRWVAAAMYMLSPYILDYLDRISAILMPWAALGWMVGLTVAAARRGGWRHPALFAVIVAVVGGVNATSIVLVLTAPVVWLAYATWATREIDMRRAVATVLRLGVLVLGVSLWWLAGLWAEDRYGINVLRVTETVPTVSMTSSASEVLRGLGYWYFYGWDKVQPWTLQSVPYEEAPWLLALTFMAVPLSIVAGWVARWRYRGYCLSLVAVGTVVAVGAFPFSEPSIFGSVIKRASAGSELALAMRSVDRIVPILLLGLSLMAGSGITALHLRRPAAGWIGAGAALAVVAAELPAIWTGGLIASNLSRGAIPSYWTQAAAYLDSQAPGTRVLGLPGEDFAAYAWGVTEDPIGNGLLDRGFVDRQVVPTGTPAAANLLQALDEPMQEQTLDYAALVPVARLMSVGQILLQSDLQYERYHLPLPETMYRNLTSDRAGLGAPVASFGQPTQTAPIRYPLISEERLGLPTGSVLPPPLTVFDVPDPRPVVRAEPEADPVILAGDGKGIVEAGSAGLLSGNSPILYAADLSQQPQAFQQAMDAGATLVVTDTNPLAEYEWGGLQAQVGQVEQPGVTDPSVTPSDYPLPVFPGETTADQTVAVVSGIRSVEATQYGDLLSFTPEFKPINALDGDPTSSWRFGAYEPVAGIRLTVQLQRAVTAGQVTLHQVPVTGRYGRRITAVTLLFDNRDPVTVPLTEASISPSGQTVTFPPRTFSRFDLVVDGATGGANKRYDGLPAVGFSEISIPGVAPATESLRVPTDLLDQAGAASLEHPLDLLFNRWRAPQPPRRDPEPYMSRTVQLPTARTFSIAGTAEINAVAPSDLIDRLVGVPGTDGAAGDSAAVVIDATSSNRLIGDRAARAGAAVDGDPGTAWIAETGPQDGEWLDYRLSKPVTVDHMDLQVLNDGHHSLPSQITISTAAGSRTVTVPVPPVGYGRPANSTTTIPLSFPSLTGSDLRITIDRVRPVESLDYFSVYAGIQDELPVGIAELGIPGVSEAPPPPAVPSRCRADLLAIDGHPVDVEVSGSTADALAGEQLSLLPCGNSLGGVHLPAGTHTITTSPPLPAGWSIDQLWLTSAPGGGPGIVPATGPQESLPSQPAPAVRVLGQDRTSLSVAVTGDGRPSWLVLGQSYSSGWTAAGPGGASLGSPRLVDAFANGWLLPAIPAGATVVYHLHWAPQDVIWAAIGVSAASLAACVLIAVLPSAGVWPRRRRNPRERRPVTPTAGGPAPASLAALLAAGPPARLRWRSAVAVLLWGALWAGVSRPVIGGMAAVALALAAGFTWGRVAVRAGALSAFLGLGGYMVAQQVAHRYWPAIAWPGDFSLANDLAWSGLALVMSDLAGGAWRVARAAAGP